MMQPIAFKTVPLINRIRSKLLILTWLILAGSGVQATPIWHIFGDYEYALTDEYLNFLDAEQLAVDQYGAHLASIHSAEENAFILDLVAGTYNASGYYPIVWIGGWQGCASCNSGANRWLDGTPWDYANLSWDDSSSHEALLMWTEDYQGSLPAGTWGDWEPIGLNDSLVSRAVMKRLATTANNPPIADAGDNATVDEFELVTLDGSDSYDPDDGDNLSYAWYQLDGPPVDLLNGTTSSPSFVAPQVPAGGVDLVFELVVTDDFSPIPLASSPDEVTIHVANVYDPPSCDLAYPSSSSIWPPNHKLVPVTLEGISSTQNLSTDILVYAVTQDEPINADDDGNTNPDAALMLQGNIDSVLLRAERDGEADGRVYTIYFDAANEFESCSGSIQVGVPLNRKSTAVDSGEAYSSL